MGRWRGRSSINLLGTLSEKVGCWAHKTTDTANPVFVRSAALRGLFCNLVGGTFAGASARALVMSRLFFLAVKLATSRSWLPATVRGMLFIRLGGINVLYLWRWKWQVSAYVCFFPSFFFLWQSKSRSDLLSMWWFQSLTTMLTAARKVLGNSDTPWKGNLSLFISHSNNQQLRHRSSPKGTEQNQISSPSAVSSGQQSSRLWLLSGSMFCH